MKLRFWGKDQKPEEEEETEEERKKRVEEERLKRAGQRPDKGYFGEGAARGRKLKQAYEDED